ncbi:hypothetical protein BO99DRAFT_262024 [Aspergillus violaceofuscus CBS 115571]|uniref:Uncharacterized protein n=1 Tax=Aspergillus violaceofuscus (strain CBS 115571) TaxID=1450538 RepID=A0A2V5GUX6_ASPV1|nr:hypothetical protein BO99DRAFT_262024 [Aspergillus violaceofuscus CBS 115571]
MTVSNYYVVPSTHCSIPAVAEGFLLSVIITSLLLVKVNSDHTRPSNHIHSRGKKPSPSGFPGRRPSSCMPYCTITRET